MIYFTTSDKTPGKAQKSDQETGFVRGCRICLGIIELGYVAVDPL